MAITDKKEDDGSMIWSHSIVSQQTGDGLVQLTWGDKKAQLTCEEARQHALVILECADAAESDACLVRFLGKIGMEREDAVKILVDFRVFRHEGQHRRRSEGP